MANVMDVDGEENLPEGGHKAVGKSKSASEMYQKVGDLHGLLANTV